MTLGALIDAGARLRDVKATLKTLPLGGYTITAHKEQRNHITGTKVNIRVSKSYKHPGRHLSTICNLIKRSKISPRAKRDACGIFNIIGRAEAQIHDVPVEDVHFHEVGAVDSIVDIVGVAVAIDMLGIETFHTGRVPLGSGFVDIAHGRIPVPVPATIKILEGAEVRYTDYRGEIVTPTGAGILKYYCSDFSGRTGFKVDSVGYGFGERFDKRLPGMLRLVIGEVANDHLDTTMEVIETNIDEMDAAFYEAVIDKLLDAGALDAFITPIQMKKNRPGRKLTVLAEKPVVNKLIDVIFRETTPSGLRIYTVRKKLAGTRGDRCEDEVRQGEGEGRDDEE